jgi:hypothetical protein
MWACILSILTSWSADPAAIDLEQPKAAAAVAYAYAHLASDVPPSKDPYFESTDRQPSASTERTSNR